jgi:hypothetical protein
MTWRSAAVTSLVAALLLACGMPRPSSPAAGEGPGGREQPLALTPRQELAVGLRAYQEVMEQARGRLLPDDDPRVIRVRRVLDRLVKASEIEPLQREIHLRLRGYRFEWEANVIRDRQINAFCQMPLFPGENGV